MSVVQIEDATAEEYISLRMAPIWALSLSGSPGLLQRPNSDYVKSISALERHEFSIDRSSPNMTLVLTLFPCAQV